MYINNGPSNFCPPQPYCPPTDCFIPNYYAPTGPDLINYFGGTKPDLINYFGGYNPQTYHMQSYNCPPIAYHMVDVNWCQPSYNPWPCPPHHNIWCGGGKP